MFTIEDREHIRDRVLQIAATDPRVIAGAVVGSLALSDGDRWSDLDLTFAVDDNFLMYNVLEDWTRRIVSDLDAVQLFDVPSGPSIYRVFLLPGCLQFDLSFTPASHFGATGPKFRLLFGRAIEKPFPPSPLADEIFGQAVHHALRARFCIERGRYWQAAYWINSARDCALNLACLRRGLPSSYGRGYDDLPVEVHDVFANSFMVSLTRDELLRSLKVVINGLLSETPDVQDLANKVTPRLRELILPD